MPAGTATPRESGLDARFKSQIMRLVGLGIRDLNWAKEAMLPFGVIEGGK